MLEEAFEAAVRQEILVALGGFDGSDGSENVEGPIASAQQMMTGAEERFAIGPDHASREVSIVRIELGQGCEQSIDIVRCAQWNDVQIKGRDRSACCDRGNATDDDELHLMTGEDLEGFFKL